MAGTREELPLRELSFQFVRSSGAGGQNVNKVASKAVLRWHLPSSRWLAPALRQRLEARNRRRITVDGELVLSSQRFRDQGRNVADCLEKLRALLEEAAHVPKPRRPTRPTRGARERRLEGKRRQAEKKARRRPALD